MHGPTIELGPLDLTVDKTTLHGMRAVLVVQVTWKGKLIRPPHLGLGLVKLPLLKTHKISTKLHASYWK